MNRLQSLDSLKWDAQGLIPAIVQDEASKQVLMMAYMNEQSLQKTIDTKETWFWSRSRGELWHKGATSGNKQLVKAIHYDCDADSLLVLVEPLGPACHTGEVSCYYNPLLDESKAEQANGSEDDDSDNAGSPIHILSALEDVIAARDEERPEGAYTTYLFEQGIDKILKKVGEESAEVIIAAKNQDHEELRNETADLLYHLMVLLREAKLPLNSVMQVLEDRHVR